MIRLRKIIGLILLVSFVVPAFAVDVVPRYNRKEWRHWIDEDRDCQNTRHELLIDSSLVAVTFRSERQCSVATGEWFGPYTGQTFYSSSKLDIDHLVPLSHAHYTGGHAWTPDQKRIFANDPENLIPVFRSENRRKGNKGPDRYRPPNRDYWCDYATRWQQVKEKYGLTVSGSEARSVERMLATCDSHQP